VGTTYIDHTEHRDAKKNGRTVTLNSVTVDVKIEWLNSGLGRGGHTFNVSWVDENGNYVGIMALDPTTPSNRTDEKQAAITNLFPNYAGCFGINALKVDPVQVFPVGLNVSDEYRITLTETVDYTVVV
jgi:hypothetical protein